MIRDSGGFVAGLLFLSVGLGAIGIASGYRVGSALHMGPGYFPVVVGVLLVLVGAASVVQGLSVTVAGGERVALRPVLVIGAAVAVFALAIDRIGLVPTVFVAALLACMAGPKPAIVESCVIAAVLAAMAAGIFYYGLKLPFSLF
ncbi:MAG TPA: tripartite tricarboxylate transporter TctB family protein [Rhodopila sp.]